LESLHLSLLPRPLLSKENTLARKGLWVVTSDWAVLLTWPVTQRNRFLCNNCRGILSLTRGARPSCGTVKLLGWQCGFQARDLLFLVALLLPAFTRFALQGLAVHQELDKL
jgi:LSD1 subclass zinc finger protein